MDLLHSKLLEYNQGVDTLDIIETFTDLCSTVCTIILVHRLERSSFPKRWFMEFWQWLRDGNNEACKVVVIIEAARLRRAGSRTSQSTRRFTNDKE